MSDLGGEEPRRVALTGAGGMLAQAVHAGAPAGYETYPFFRDELDITNVGQLREKMSSLAPNVIINCAAYANVDDCERHEIEATRVNGAGPGYLATVAKEIDATLVHISTDYVFDGKKQKPYKEADATNPLSAYGRSKVAGEQAIIESGLGSYFILRTGWLYGEGGSNFVQSILRLGAERDELRIVEDQRGSPTYTSDFADALFRLLDTEQFNIRSQHASIGYGIYHLSNEGDCSWYDFARTILDEAAHSGIAVRASEVLPINSGEYPQLALRPQFSVLSKDKYIGYTNRCLPEWHDGLVRYMKSVACPSVARQGSQK